MSSPTLLWIRQIGSANPDFAAAIATDHEANVFISGSTSGDLDGQSRGSSDAFLAKFDAQGNQLWLKQLGAVSEDRAYGIATDPMGNVFISGTTSGDLDGQSRGSSDAFLAKFDTRGNQLWLKQLGAARDDSAQAIATDQQGNVFISGYTSGDLDGQSKGSYDAFLAKFDAQGKQLWLKQLGAATEDSASDITTDLMGNVFISGSTSGDLDGQSKGGSDAFLAKFDAQGNQLWLKQLGAARDDSAQAIATDLFGNVFISGRTSGDLDGQSKGGSDAFLVKFDAQGNQLWLKQLGSATEDQSFGIATDSMGNIFISGRTSGDLDGQSKGGSDAFLAKFDAQGNQLWLEQLGSARDDSAQAIATDQQGNVFISGYTLGVLGGQSKGSYDAFLARYMDGLSISQHHLILSSRIDKLSSELAELKHAQLPVDLNLALIQAANGRTKGKGDGRISKADVKEIIVLARDAAGNISETNQKTLAYLFARYSLTGGAKELILKALS